MQKVLTITTSGSSLRHAAIGWSHCNPDYVLPEQIYLSQKHIGLVRSHENNSNYCYPTVLQALADGWKLLGMPREYEQKYHDKVETECEWWLVKD